MNNSQRANKLEKIKEQLINLVDECREILNSTDIIDQRAEAYWLGHLDLMLTHGNEYDHTIDDTIDELRDVCQNHPPNSR